LNFRRNRLATLTKKIAQPMPISGVDKRQRSWVASAIRSDYFANLRRTTSKNSNNAKKTGGVPPPEALTAAIEYANTAYLLLKFRLAVDRE
jgi:hypothetical protein